MSSAADHRDELAARRKALAEALVHDATELQHQMAGSVESPTARLPHVVIRNADELHLASGEAVVVTGGRDSALLIDEVKYAVSNEDPVVIRPHGPGIEGGTITLTLICGSILGETRPDQEAPDA